MSSSGTDSRPGDVMRRECALGCLDEGWDEMVRQNPHATVFQTREWYAAWIGSVAEAESAEPVILRIPQCGAPRAGLAVQISPGRERGSVIRPLSAPWADYHEAVGDPRDREGIELLAQALSRFVVSCGCPLVFEDVTPGGMLATALSAFAHPAGLSSVTESISLVDDDHWMHIFSGKEHETKLRRLKRLGTVHCSHHTAADAVQERLTTFIEMHRRQWQDRPDAVAPFDGGVIDEAFRAIACRLAPAGRVVLTELTLDSRPLAMYLGFRHADRYHAYRTTFNREFKRFSPGHLMLRQMMADFRNCGIKELDLMRGGYAYKEQYASKVSHNLRFEIPN